MKKTDKIANILGRSAIIFSLILSSCHSAKEISLKPTSSRAEKIESVHKALNLCWDIFVDKNTAYSSDKKSLYEKYKNNSDELWIKFSKKNFSFFYRDDKTRAHDKIVHVIVGISTLGIGLLGLEYAMPPYDNYSYSDTRARPAYSDVVKYCDEKFDREETVLKDAEFLREQEIQRKESIEHELAKKKSLEQKRSEIAASKFKEKIESENSYAKNLGYPNGILGYDRKIYNAGILGMIYTLNQNGAIAKAKDYLIKRGRENFRVQNIVGNYAIYGYTDDNFKTYRFALEMNSRESYLQDSALRGKYFAVIGTQMFTTVMGQTVEILTFKKVE